MIQSWRAKLKSGSTWRFLITLGLVITSFGVLGYMLYSQREVIFSYNWELNWGPLFLSFVLFTAGLWVSGSVWVEIIQSMGVKIGFFRHLNYYYFSRLARRLPGTVWYVAYLAQAYKSEGLSPWLTSLGSAIELVVTVLSGILASLLFAWQVLASYPLGWLGTAALTLGCLVFLHPRLIRWLVRRFGSQADPPPYARLIRWIIVYVLLRVLVGMTVLEAINIIYPLSFSYLPYITGVYALVGVLANLLLFAPSNLGFTEVSLSLLLTTIMPSSIAVVIAVGLRVLFIAFEILGALLTLGLNALTKKHD